MKLIHSLVAKVRGKNSAATPTTVILDQLHEPRPLPLGVKEFHEWSDRIIAGSMLPADPPSLKFALAEMIMHLKATESHCPDAHFIHSLRKGAANQVAYAMMQEIRDGRKAFLAEKEEAEAKLNAKAEELAVIRETIHQCDVAILSDKPEPQAVQ